jgi:uncharacterized membrane protein (Fun14 family)
MREASVELLLGFLLGFGIGFISGFPYGYSAAKAIWRKRL